MANFTVSEIYKYFPNDCDLVFFVFWLILCGFVIKAVSDLLKAKSKFHYKIRSLQFKHINDIKLLEYKHSNDVKLLKLKFSHKKTLIRQNLEASKELERYKRRFRVARKSIAVQTSEAGQASTSSLLPAAPPPKNLENMTSLETFYVYPAFSANHLRELKTALNDSMTLSSRGQVNVSVVLFDDVDAEYGFYLEIEKGDEESVVIKEECMAKIRWFFGGMTLSDGHVISRSSRFNNESSNLILEFGPRLNFTTSFSTNAVSALKASGLNWIRRVEKSVRYRLTTNEPLSEEIVDKISLMLHDPMTECRYVEPPATLALQQEAESFFEVDVLGRGKLAFKEFNEKFGLALDQWDVDFYFDIFANKAKRNPTNVELFDLAQSNSEHSRHWFFKGKLLIDGVEAEKSLFQMVMDTQSTSNPNNVIKFCDNSSAIEGATVKTMKPDQPGSPCALNCDTTLKHITYTAETHNFPTGVSPFSGAATGTGGRIRDGHAAGRGSHVVAAAAGYSFGNLHIPGYNLPWESPEFAYPGNLAKPLDVCIQASNGASDYGNKFGEAVICGFARSFGETIKVAVAADDGVDPEPAERVEYVKPIMFSGGQGTIDGDMLEKMKPQPGMIVAKIGGPVYRIGVGGGSASSANIQDGKSRCEQLDFSAVQRGDAQMEQKLNRVVRACVEMGGANPIKSIHDQGAGGNGNVLKEIVEGAGAVIYADRFELGDPTINALELWGAEYQESDAILIDKNDMRILSQICQRERCPVSFVGDVTNDNKITLIDFKAGEIQDFGLNHPVNLNLDWILGSMPRKTFTLKKGRKILPPLSLPPDFTLLAGLERILRLPAVASKRYLTNKVDRSITGLVAQQQCVGCLHTPLADVAVTALSYFDTVGSAFAIGEQPVKILSNPERGARMCVGEALTNLVFAPITDLKDVKCSANWMWAAKLPGEGEKLYSACKSMCDVMTRLGIAVDGGKDSLSMAALVKKNDHGSSEVVKSPGTLVVSAYARCPDITKVITPDLKCTDDKPGSLFYICFGNKQPQHRLGGSALAQCYKQVGDDAPDLSDADLFRSAFNVTQQLIKDGLILSGHDVSDGGLITCLLEMCFTGNCGLEINLPFEGEPQSICFGEELGVIVEAEEKNENLLYDRYHSKQIFCTKIGRSIPTYGPDAQVSISLRDNEILLHEKLATLRNIWEETSYQLDKLQCTHSCVESERLVMQNFVKSPLKWDHREIMKDVPRQLQAPGQFRVAVVREEGSNGDREMSAAFLLAGFEAWDVCMQDLLNGHVTLDQFHGLAFVGGFSYADVFGAAKGWASSMLYNEKLRAQFDWFYRQSNKFSFGACNGCQLMAQIGWIGALPEEMNDQNQQINKITLAQNQSERFESRFSSVLIEDSKSIMLSGMAGSILGVWVAHGEGKFTCPDETTRFSNLLRERLVCARYVDGDGTPTETYPLNPNGSALGIAAVCSPDGRHLAIMPHPERSFMTWQWPYYPKRGTTTSSNLISSTVADGTNLYSPWMKMFQNAHEWCLKNYDSS